MCDNFPEVQKYAYGPEWSGREVGPGSLAGRAEWRTEFYACVAKSRASVARAAMARVATGDENLVGPAGARSEEK